MPPRVINEDLLKFRGYYVLESFNGNKYMVKLVEDSYENSYEISRKNELLDTETGCFKYNKKDNELILHGYYRKNKEIGLLKDIDVKYIFKITTNKNNQLEFNSKKYKLRRY